MQLMVMLFAKGSYSICTLTFLKRFFELETIFFLYEQPYLVQSMLFASSYCPLVLKEVRHKRCHTRFAFILVLEIHRFCGLVF